MGRGREENEITAAKLQRRRDLYMFRVYRTILKKEALPWAIFGPYLIVDFLLFPDP
jgi:hypothetical protein